ncbi:extracellular solute-binding protein [Seminavis robusta]|uniref:Extracellular solute-binding protein n=1 Tax=Seminavis robusta TaxID=568900 RepID=A0A9N8DU79_9STRA|nr:extracellular solute-binding protein [Seminavis robusta]|eukprot:Sro282_g107620.1 extracellular solute-binding protein (822) ;mRNA; r:77057-79767
MSHRDEQKPTVPSWAEQRATCAGFCQSVVHKDPLDIGVPFPVVIGPEPTAEGGTKDVGKVEDCHSGSMAKGNQLHPGVEATNSPKNVKTEELDSAMSNHEGPSFGAATTSVEFDEEMPAPRLVRYSEADRVPMALPGSYAICGPGIAEEHHNSLVDSNLLIGTVSQQNTCNHHPESPMHSHACHDAGTTIVPEATLVSHDGPETYVQAEAKPLPLNKYFSKRAVLVGFGLLALVILGLVIGVIVLFSEMRLESNGGEEEAPLGPKDDVSKDDEGSVSRKLSALQRIQRNGVVRFAVDADAPSFVQQFSDTQSSGGDRLDTFGAGLGRAVAAAALGENATFEFVPVPAGDMYAVLANQSAEMLAGRMSMNMLQDVFEVTVGEGLVYATPNQFMGLSFAGVPSFVSCADDSFNTVGECSGLKICINRNTFFLKELLQRVPHRQVVVVDRATLLFENFLKDNCNVMGTETPHIIPQMLRTLGYTGDLALGKRIFTSGMLSFVSLDSDPEWSDFLRAVTLALLAAHHYGITKETAGRMGQTILFGEMYKNMFIHAVRSGDPFAGAFEIMRQTTGRNFVNNRTGGMLASPPLGNLGALPTGDRQSLKGGTLESVIANGVLCCGVRSGRPGFAMYSTSRSDWDGMDVDYCYALAASLFNGKFQALQFHKVNNSSGFEELHSGVIDVLVGVEWTLENDVREPTTNTGYSFSQPYFYAPADDSSFDENLCIATRQDDTQWSAFVWWTAQSIVYAEEKGIFQGDSNEMPLADVFGTALQRMFRDAVNAIGNYKEVYTRNLARILPRGGRNMLNSLNESTPLFYLPRDLRY